MLPVTELDLIDSLIKDIDLKKNYNARYNFYMNFIKMYNQNPKIIKYIYTKLNAIKNLNENEKGLLGKLNFATKKGEKQLLAELLQLEGLKTNETNKKKKHF